MKREYRENEGFVLKRRNLSQKINIMVNEMFTTLRFLDKYLNILICLSKLQIFLDIINVFIMININRMIKVFCLITQDHGIRKSEFPNYIVNVSKIR